MSIPTMYICLETFTASNGHRFKKDDTVSSFKVNNLPPKDRLKFKPKEELIRGNDASHPAHTYSGIEGHTEDLPNAQLDNATPINTPTEKAADDSPAFSGWGGGDTGGGGSSSGVDYYGGDNSSSISDSSSYSDSGSSDSGGASGDY